LNCFTIQHDAMEITVTCHPWSLKITILGTKQVSRKMGAYHPGPIDQLLNEQKVVVVEDTVSSKVDSTIAVKVDKERLENELIDLTRALYFHHFKEKWLDSINVYPNFLLELESEHAREENQPIENMDKLTNVLFENEVFYGENPDVFKYQVADGQATCHKLIRLYFYNGNRVTVMVGKNG